MNIIISCWTKDNILTKAVLRNIIDMALTMDYTTFTLDIIRSEKEKIKIRKSDGDKANLMIISMVETEDIGIDYGGTMYMIVSINELLPKIAEFLGVRLDMSLSEYRKDFNIDIQ